MIAGDALTQLLERYLDRHFQMEHAGVWAAVDAFARGQTYLAPDLRGEVEQLLHSGVTDEDLRTFMADELKSGYNPEGDGWTYRAWFAEVAERVDLVLRYPHQAPSEPIPGHEIVRPRRQMQVARNKGASSFLGAALAESTVAEVLSANAAKIEEWLGSTGGGLRVATTFSEPVGRLAFDATHEVTEVNDVAVILRREPSTPPGYRVHAAYPAASSARRSAKRRRTALAQFLGVYLHQNWRIDYTDVWAAIEDFVASDRQHALGIHADVPDLLWGLVPSDKKLRMVVIDDLDCWYQPESEGWTYRAWLQAVSERVNDLLDLDRGPDITYQALTINRGTARQAPATPLYACPVCGCESLEDKPYELWPPPDRVDLQPPYEVQLGAASHDRCARCGFEFGWHDNSESSGRTSFDDYRTEWEAKGSPWFSEPELERLTRLLQDDDQS
jgi:hypothetical protein